MANSLTQNQLYTVLNAIAKQATGRTDIAATDTSSFVTVADITLKAGTDNVISAISQVLSRTIFSIRPYTRKFQGLETDAIRFGNHVRKIAICDKDWEKDDRLPLTDGQSVDPWKINKPSVLQTNFYGQEVYQRSYTLFKDQLDVAFSSESELSQFITLVTSNCSDLIEQAHEELARMTIANAIGGIIALDKTEQIIHLLTEYNTATGLSLTSTTVYQPANFKPFIEWAYARMASVSEMLTERSILYHNNISGKEVSRHTPKDMQRAYIYTPTAMQIESMALADIYNDQYLKMVPSEKVNFWQSIETPDSINIKAGFTDANGEPDSDTVSQANIFALICDREMMGYTTINEWSAATPLNPRGGYSNVFFHFTDRYYFDNFENGVVFLLD